MSIKFEDIKASLDNFKLQQISLIASESIPWLSVTKYENFFSRKYAEGYPGHRYYAGCKILDTIESFAIEQGKLLFGAEHCNVQPLSGSAANLAVYLSCLKPFDTILGMNLKAGGHLTHGSKVSISGKWFNAINYGVNYQGLIDYDEVQRLAYENKPKLIIAGASSYSRIIDFKAFRNIADSVNAFLLCDIAHFAGLIAGNAYPNPVEYADFVTSTTHKTLRGPRGGLILCKQQYAKSIDRAVFPGLQGGPFMHSIIGKACAFSENYSQYAQQLILNARALAKSLSKHGFEIYSNHDGNYTDCHMFVIKVENGLQAQNLLEEANILCNRNYLPQDGSQPTGIRFGSTIITNLGFDTHDCEKLGDYIGQLLTKKISIVNMQEFIATLISKASII